MGLSLKSFTKSLPNSKVFKYGSPLDPQAYNRMQYAEDRDELLTGAREASAQRKEISDLLTSLTDEQRKIFEGVWMPLEKQMGASVQAGLNPDINAINQSAQTEAANEATKAAGIRGRYFSRLGLSDTTDPRKTAIKTAASSVDASNRAVRDAIDTGKQNAAQFYGLGSDLPSSAGSELAASGSQLANMMDYINMMKQAKVSGNIERDVGLGTMAGDIMGGFG